VNHSEDASGSNASGSNIGSSPTASHCLGKVEPSTITAEYGHATHVSSYWNLIWHQLLHNSNTAFRFSQYTALQLSTHFNHWPGRNHDGLVNAVCYSILIFLVQEWTSMNEYPGNQMYHGQRQLQIPQLM